MTILQKKPRNIEWLLYEKLPDHIKDILGGPDNVDMTTNIVKEAGLTEEFRPYINTVVFGLFVGELNPKLLTPAVKEWLAIDEAKAQLVSALIRKTFIEPNQAFLDSLYKERLLPAQGPSVPHENVVNLKKELH